MAISSASSPPPDRSGFMRRPVRLRVTVTAPRGSSVESRVHSADLRTVGVLRDVHSRSGAGDTVIETATGDVNVECGSGNVEVDQIHGRLRYHSGSGDLRVARRRRSPHRELRQRRIRIEAIRAGAKITAASGAIEIERAYAGEVSVQAASGNITVGVPAGVGVFIDATAMSGRASSELPVTDKPASGRPELSLRLRSLSGNVRVVRAPDAPATVSTQKVFTESPVGSATEVQLEK
ncbi:DUF4097 family beta strand repeat-containing protein [Fodinicola feengrottensis]|uniref:DUF4097 family beta strand repeat-containing protein n=1 Tax=Fodinicola feengrottensis TaxID=435914 RepID=UPI0013D50990|nr:DUF4097 family beta strand repeat-containing protein [Fodinicola feengrottensis]